MPAHRLVSEQQQQMLLTAMEADRDLALGRVVPTAGPMAKQSAVRKWEVLASRLNAVGEGCTKTAIAWKKHWLNLKYLTRKKVVEMGRHARGTGGGPPCKLRLTPVEEKIMRILGEVSVNGHPEVRIPFSPQQEEVDDAPEHAPLADAASTSESEHTAESPLLCIPAVGQEVSPHASGSGCAPAGSSGEPPRASGSGGDPAGSSEEPPCASRTGAIRTSSEGVVRQPLPNSSGLTSSTRPQPRFQAAVPQWAMQIEERHLEFEERTARALENIGRTQQEIVDLLRTLLGVVGERLPRFELE